MIREIKKNRFVQHSVVTGLISLVLLSACDELEAENPADLNYTLKNPTLTSAHAISDTRIDITWQNNEEHTEEFIVQRKSEYQAYHAITVVPKEVLNYSDTTCSLGVSYSYAVITKVESNQSVQSNEKTISTAFPPPSNMEIGDISDITKQVGWEDNCNFEEGYVIQRDGGSGFLPLYETAENITNYVDFDLIPGVEYSYRVAGYTKHNKSSWLTSNPISTNFPAPYDLTATPLSESEIGLSWADTCTFEDGFIIERDAGLGYEQLIEISANITNYTDTGLSIGIIYTYRIRSYTAHSASSYSNTFQATVLYDGLIPVPGGAFSMGDVWGDGYENEIPVHEVVVNSFYMSSTEVTTKQFIEFLNDLGVGANGFWYHFLINMESQERAIGHNGSFYFIGSPYTSSELDPVTHVTWWGAMEYCNWLSLSAMLTPCYTVESGDRVICDWNANGYRLPTEAEWEYAARSGGRDDQKWSGTGVESEIANYTWFRENSNNKTHPVGELEPNELGLYDMSGNVQEFCWDLWGSYTAENQNNPHGPEIGPGRVIKGGDYSTTPTLLRCSQRNGLNPIASGLGRGFRIARNGQ
jgi:formylglycine-generating enzyme required for sulfatase activity